MRVLLIGGTGFLGGYLAQALAQKGHEPILMGRNPPRSSPFPFRSCDITREEPDLDGVEAVVYLVGIIREKGGLTFQKAHVEGVRNTLKAMGRQGLRRLVHVSALGARPGTGSRYFETKAQGEALVEGSGLDWTILRPSLIFGPGDEFFGQVLRGLVRTPLPFVPLIGDGRFPFRPVYAGDVARVAVAALERPFLGRLDLVGPREYTFRELLDLVQGVLGTRKPYLSIPLGLLDRLVPLLAPLPFAPITPDQYRMLKAGNTAPFSPELKALLPDPKGLEEVLPLYLKGAPALGASR